MPSEQSRLLPNLNHHHEPHLGVFACMSLIINKMIGTGIFSTPALIFYLCGNIGTSLILWVIGGIVTFCGLSVYLEFGLELPFNGGEKNYLQRVFTRPRKLIDCVYAAQIVLLGFSSGNSYAFGKYVLFAITGKRDGEDDWISRVIGVGVITFAIYLHVSHSGLIIPKEEFKSSGVLIAGVFFNKIFEESITSRVLPIMISLSNLGNVFAVSFSHSRINQELAKESLLPYSKWLSHLPNSMFLHWLVTVLVLILPPNGDVYQFVVNLYSYPGTWINILVTLGLFYLQYNRVKEGWGCKDEEHRWHSYWAVSFVFLMANVFLAVFPFVPPPVLSDNGYPYYVFPVTGVSVLLSGGVYWAVKYRK
ncbi:unnamed protein product [Wickerhamomyces anomalus]